MADTEGYSVEEMAIIKRVILIDYYFAKTLD